MSAYAHQPDGNLSVGSRQGKSAIAAAGLFELGFDRAHFTGEFN